jgi:hypothetical protein
MSDPDDDALIEAVAGAYRERDGRGAVRSHPAWHDLDAAGREAAWEVAARSRAMESAMDPGGLSTTARAVLARIRRGG